MGNNEDRKSSKPEKSSLPASQDQANIHIYPDWAAMQAYYGPQMTMAPYYNSAIAPGHASPYIWGPAQPMMPPYGAPYATIYSHGGVYTHPAVLLGSHAPDHSIPTLPMDATPLSVETPKKSSGNTDQNLKKTLKGFNGLSMSVDKNVTVRAEQSAETEVSSNDSDGNTTGTDETGKKRSRERTPTIGGDGKTKAKSNSVPLGEDVILEKALNATVPPVAPIVFTAGLELKNPPRMNAKSSPSEAWLQDERELKREKRKQSNRESARRSRLRKQAETEELARKVESLTADNVALKCEINQLAETAEKLKQENAALVEKLKNAESGQSSEIILSDPGGLSNLAAADRNVQEGKMYDKNSKSGPKLHQLLDTSSRADVVAAV